LCFSVAECEEILTLLSPNYSARHSAFQTNSATFSLEKYRELVQQRVFAEITEFIPSDLYFLDLFVVKYDMETQQGLESHSDGCLLSITLQLNNPLNFTGGGTRFTDSKQDFCLEQGECLLFRSKIEHQGKAITSGERIILVGFIETKRPGILSKEYFYNKQDKPF
jgi:hypothetical protein